MSKFAGPRGPHSEHLVLVDIGVWQSFAEEQIAFMGFGFVTCSCMTSSHSETDQQSVRFLVQTAGIISQWWGLCGFDVDRWTGQALDGSFLGTTIWWVGKAHERFCEELVGEDLRIHTCCRVTPGQK